eukprot:g32248.t1
MVSVYFYVPNLIGYARIILLFVAYELHRYPDKIQLTGLAYFLSCFLDALDGLAARALNQSSKFGAVLDMVTDRTATTCLCILLGQLYPQFILVLTGLVTLDIFSHWAQMYASLSAKKESHKDNAHPLLRLYYSRKILFTVCFWNEAFFLTAYMIGRGFEGQKVLDIPVPLRQHLPALVVKRGVTAARMGFIISMPFFAFKQLTNLVQMKVAFDQINECEAEEKKRQTKKE